MKLFLRLSYLGTQYLGYQVQESLPTVQKILNETAERVFGFPCDIVGCSRTDSGVHAEEFCVTVSEKGRKSLEVTIPIHKIPLALNSLLPDDISVFEATLVSEKFHPRYDVKYKRYVYRMWNGKYKNPFLADRMLYLPKQMGEEQIARMNAAAKLFVGKHDFRAFMAAGSKVKDTTRTVFDASVTKEGDVISFRVTADGFLYNMVRIMTGTLIEIGKGRGEPDSIKDILVLGERKNAGRTAPAFGLYLEKVSYEDIKEESHGYFQVYC